MTPQNHRYMYEQLNMHGTNVCDYGEALDVCSGGTALQILCANIIFERRQTADVCRRFDFVNQ